MAAQGVGRVHPADWLHVGDRLHGRLGQGGRSRRRAGRGRPGFDPGPHGDRSMGPRHGNSLGVVDRGALGRTDRQCRSLGYRGPRGTLARDTGPRDTGLRGDGLAYRGGRSVGLHARGVLGCRGQPGRHPFPSHDRSLDQLRDPDDRLLGRAGGTSSRTCGRGSDEHPADPAPRRSAPSRSWPPP